MREVRAHDAQDDAVLLHCGAEATQEVQVLQSCTMGKAKLGTSRVACVYIVVHSSDKLKLPCA